MHPTLDVIHKICGRPSAQELAMAMAAVGLAQNLGALRALTTEGIQRGHMSLHARSIAVTIGALNREVQKIADRMVASNRVNAAAAKELLNELRAEERKSPVVPTSGDLTLSAVAGLFAAMPTKT